MPNHNASPGRGTLFFLSAAVGGLSLLITAVLNGQTAGFYPKALEAFAAVRGTGPDAFFLAVTWLGSFYLLGPVVMLAILALAAYRSGARRRRSGPRRL